MSDEDHMNRMDPRRFEELKEAYALNALSEEERQAFEQYLAENPSEQPEVEELSQVAALLALAPPEQEPPAGLRRSLMSQVRSEASESTETNGEAVASGSTREHRGGWTWRLFGARGVVTAVAAAAIIGLAAWNVTLQFEVRELNNTEMSAYELQGSGRAEQVQGELVRIGEDRAMLVATNLPELPEGKTYEMWSIDEGEPEPRGLFGTANGPTVESLERPISGADTFAITVEPEGGSEQPTTDPIVTADLTTST